MIRKVLFLMTFSFTLFGSELIIKESSCSVEQTVFQITKILKKKELAIFATIDHAANASGVGMKLPESTVIIFGNPKLGTKLMQEDIMAGLDLPLKILVYEDSDGKVKMAYRDGSWLAENHNIHSQERVGKVNDAMDKITTRAGQCKKD